MNRTALVVISIVLLVMALIGLALGGQTKLVIGDLMGSASASLLAAISPTGRNMVAGATAFIAVSIGAWLAITAHARPWILGISMLAMFPLWYLALTSASRSRGAPHAPQPRTS
jgi:hypothetical protein